MRPKRWKADNLISSLKVHIVQDRIRQDREQQCLGQERKDQNVEKKYDRKGRDAVVRNYDSVLSMMMIIIICEKDDPASIQWWWWISWEKILETQLIFTIILNV